MANRLVVPLFAFLLVPAAALADVTLHIHTTPPGAMLSTKANSSWGATPAALKWKTPRRWKDCLAVEPITVTWISGASVTYSDLQLCPAQSKTQQITIARPTGVEGLSEDIQYAAMLASLTTQAQVQASAAEAAARLAAAALNGWVQGAAAAQRRQTCYSNLIGSTIVTTCY